MRFVLLFAILSLIGCTGGTSSSGKPSRQVRAADDSTLETGWYFVADTATRFRRTMEGGTEVLYLQPGPIIVAADIIKLEVFKNYQGAPGLAMEFDEESTPKWAEATANAVGKRLAFVVDDRLLSAPLVQGEVPNGVSAVFLDGRTMEQYQALIDEIQK